MSEQQIQKVRVKRLAHVGLWTTDVASQVRFYRQVMGFDMRVVEPSSAGLELELEDANVFLALGGEHHCLGLFSEARPATTSPHATTQRTRLHHMAFELDTDADLAALAARLKQSDIELTLGQRDGNPEAGDTLWFSDPDGNRIEISVAPDNTLTPANSGERQAQLRPRALQHIALQTPRLEVMVEFYTDALGFDISDWLLRDCVWLRCNHDHHTIMLIKGKQDIDHIGYSISAAPEVLLWADYLGRQQTPLLWGPGRHGAGNDLFLRFADSEGVQVELSAELQQYYDRDSTTPPRLWHARPTALNLWGVMPPWTTEERRG